MDRTDFIIHNADTYAVPMLEKALSRLSNSTSGSRYILPRIWSQAGFSMREAIEEIEKEREPELRRFYIHLLAEPLRLGMRHVLNNLDSFNDKEYCKQWLDRLQALKESSEVDEKAYQNSHFPKLISYNRKVMDEYSAIATRRIEVEETKAKIRKPNPIEAMPKSQFPANPSVKKGVLAFAGCILLSLLTNSIAPGWLLFLFLATGLVYLLLTLYIRNEADKAYHKHLNEIARKNKQINDKYQEVKRAAEAASHYLDEQEDKLADDSYFIVRCTIDRLYPHCYERLAAIAELIPGI